MKVFITGGAGFIGSHLATRLVERGDHVIVLDDLSTGSMENIAHLRDRDNFEYRIGSCTDQPLVTELTDLADTVVHLAAAVGVRLIVERPIYTIETNIGGTETVLHAAQKKNKKVVVASTSEVYGNSKRIPFQEEDDLQLGPTTHSRWAYACSKAMDEWLAMAYLNERKVPVVICRFFNTVGPGQTGQYGMVLPNFVKQCLKNEPITVFGTGEQTRCFGHVRDTVEALTRLMEHEAAVGEVFNIGSSEEVSILDLAERVKAASGSTSEIQLIPYEEAYAKGFEDMMRRVPDCSKLEGVIGFRPTTPLDEIIEDVISRERAKLGA